MVNEDSTSVYAIKAYGAHKKFDTEPEARALYNAMKGEDFGFVEIFYETGSKRWWVTQYVRTPFTLQEKPEGASFPEG